MHAAMEFVVESVVSEPKSVWVNKFDWVRKEDYLSPDRGDISGKEARLFRAEENLTNTAEVNPGGGEG